MKSACVLALAASSTAAFGQIQYANCFQTRSLSATGYIGGHGDSQSASAAGPGLYNTSVFADAAVQTGPNFFVHSTSLTTITSDCENDFIAISGTFSQVVGVLAGSGQTRGRVTADISFQLLSTYAYTLSGVFGIPGASPPTDPVWRDVTLNGPGGYSIAPGPFSFAGQLGPGIYTLHVDIECRKPGWDTPGFSVLFRIPHLHAPGPGPVSPIPSPGVATIGVAGMGWMMRRRR